MPSSDPPYDLDRVKAVLLKHDIVQAWPALGDVIGRYGSRGGEDWTLPLVACQAVGGDSLNAITAAAAVICSQVAIILVDDILDEDPKGHHVHIGAGRASNLAQALEALAFDMIVEDSGRTNSQVSVRALARMMLQTALGQDLDVQHPSTEEDYWTVVRRKSAPYYGLCLQLGAVMGGAAEPTARALHEMGLIVGEVVQLHDDLYDAFETPAMPDWRRGTSNLLVLYALSVDHDKRSRFRELLDSAWEPGSLGELQQILIECGAVSYCAYHLAMRHKRTATLAQDAGLVNPAPVLRFVERQMEPLRALLERAGAELPEELQSLT